MRFAPGTPMGSLGARIFSSVFVLIGAILLFIGIRALANGHASKSWPTTEGKVVASSVDSSRSRKGRRTTYHAEVLYEFRAGDIVHSSNAISSGDYGSSDPAHARSVVNRYPPGTQVTVYYSPEDPSTSFLEPGLRGSAFLLPGIGAVFGGLGLLTFIYLPRQIEKQRLLKTAASSEAGAT